MERDMKTEDEIAREKEAVQKMVGAKSAMEAALSRIDRLQKALSHADTILNDAQHHAGDGIYVRTHRHGIVGKDGEQCVKLKDQLGYARRIIQGVQ